MKKMIESWTEALNDDDVRWRFWAKVDRRGPDECWPWLATCTPQGYGVFWAARRLRPAHRVSFALHYSNQPLWKGSHICHRCDNPPCVNPAHLWQDTPGANSLDKIKKGRAPKKLSREDIIEIRKTAGDWAGARACADKFDISAGHARCIARGMYWTHVPGEAEKICSVRAASMGVTT